MRIRVVPGLVARYLVAVVLVLLILNLGGLVSEYGFGTDLIVFDLDSEGNLPTWVSVILLAFVAFLAGLISVVKLRSESPFQLHWWGLAALFALFSFDELAALHERLIGPIRGWLDLSGVFHFAWVLAGMAFTLVVGVIYLPFIRHLTVSMRNLFVASAALYVGGALGVEMLQGYTEVLFTRQSLWFEFAAFAEEGFELFGLTLFIYTLLRYLQDEPGTTALEMEKRS